MINEIVQLKKKSLFRFPSKKKEYVISSDRYNEAIDDVLNLFKTYNLKTIKEHLTSYELSKIKNPSVIEKSAVNDIIIDYLNKNVNKIKS